MMSRIYIKAVAVVVLSLFLSGCAVFVGDGYHHRRGYRHWRGSLDSPSQAANQLALNHEADHPRR